MISRLSNLTALGLAMFVGLQGGMAFASSHREAPNITRLPKVDSTDFYLFNSYEPGREGYVTIIANYLPLQDPFGGPNYFALDQRALYEIHIDNDGDAREDLTFQFRFDNDLADDGKGLAVPVGDEMVAVPLKHIGGIAPGNDAALNFVESYRVDLIRGDRRKGKAKALRRSDGGGRVFGKPYDNVGDKTFEDLNGNVTTYADYAAQFVYDTAIPGCSKPGRIFVGQRREGFAVNLGEVFDLVNFTPLEGAITQDPANNDVRDKNITSLALEVHADCLTGAGSAVIGGWTSASMSEATLRLAEPTFEYPELDFGQPVQVSRLGMPLVNELVIGLPDKDRFSATEPKHDARFATYVTNPSLPALLEVLFGVPAPTNFPRTDLVTAFLTGFAGVNQLAKVTPSEMTRLNTAIPATPSAQQSPFGLAGDDLAGFPNGRRPGDDTVDIALRVVMGRLCHPIPVAGQPTDLGLCTPADAPAGLAPFTDGAPLSAADFDDAFPYLTTPVSGSPNGPN